MQQVEVWTKVEGVETVYVNESSEESDYKEMIMNRNEANGTTWKQGISVKVVDENNTIRHFSDNVRERTKMT